MTKDRDAFENLVKETNVQRGIQHATAKLFWGEAIKFAQQHQEPRNVTKNTVYKDPELEALRKRIESWAASPKGRKELQEIAAHIEAINPLGPRPNLGYTLQPTPTEVKPKDGK